jgi:hypothetical protein
MRMPGNCTNLGQSPTNCEKPSGGQQPSDLGRRPTVAPCRRAHAARFQLLGDGRQRCATGTWISATTARVVALAFVVCSATASYCMRTRGVGRRPFLSGIS